MMTNDLLLSLHDVSLNYGKTEVLKNVTLPVYRHDFIGIIGPNGGGKTTLLKLILGIIAPTKGKIEYHNGFSIKQIGYLPQRNNTNVQFPITVKQTILSGLMEWRKIGGWFSHKEQMEAERLMELMHIKSLKNKNIQYLSGGEYQKMMLCRAIISHPKLLILDEPNTYTDHNFETEIGQILQELHREMAIMMVSHDLGIISGVVKTIACVNQHIDYHNESHITPEMMKVYGCPIDLITHGDVPHRVLERH